MLKILRVVSIVTVLWINGSLTDADNGESQPPSRDGDYGEFNLPSKVVELLRKEGVTITDLKNDNNLRRRWLTRLRILGGMEPTESAGTGEDYYQVIITNNLFRPLGYRKPRPPPPYQLIATVTNHESGANRALLRRAKDGRIYYVGLGEAFDNAKVERIGRRSVTILVDGRSREFRLPRTVLLNR